MADSGRIAAELGRAIGLLRREWRLNGLGDSDELASLQAALEFLGHETRTGPKFFPLSEVEPQDAQVLTYTLDEVAENLRVTRRTVEKIVADGDLPVVEIRGSVRVSHNGLCEFISDRTVRRSQCREPGVEDSDLELRSSARSSRAAFDWPPTREVPTADLGPEWGRGE